MITELTVACVIVVMIVMALSYGGWGIYAAICAVMVLLILLLIGVAFRRGIRKQKVAGESGRIKTAYSMLLSPLFGMLIIFIYTVIWFLVMV